MRRLFLTAALALSGAATAAASQPLPDFPVDARPGECWARTPVGGAVPEGPPAQGVWTLERGQGPQAVWSFSEQAPRLAAPGPAELDWGRVDCGSGRPLLLAEVPPPHLPPSVETAPYGPPPPPMARFDLEPEGPYADARPLPSVGPDLHPHPHPPHAMVFERRPLPPGRHLGRRFAPQPPMHHAHHGPLLRPAPLFGDRFLHWPGKVLR